ncbi:hypothetical protein CUJ84_pRLN4000117 (plasmid) [Rhizobium leguminosarum]|uniref:Uncharacterized protein n=1 Tax=Rhizobium leguminosarum TaxID=384 RepID=A0A2K9ZHS9_RHILE|nr:hypothetical protein CUJ84_pRLN4000117 [Rhizobium leguminosarum]
MGFREPSGRARAPLSLLPVNRSALQSSCAIPHDVDDGSIAGRACKRMLINGLIWDSFEWKATLVGDMYTRLVHHRARIATTSQLGEALAYIASASLQ